jgi:hypothetical protein
MGSNGVCLGQADSEGVLAARPTNYTMDLTTMHRVKLPNVRSELGYEVAVDEVDLTLPAGQQIDPRCYPITIMVSVRSGEVTLVRPELDGTVAIFRADAKKGITKVDPKAATKKKVKLGVGDYVQIDTATHGLSNTGDVDALLHVTAVRPDQSPCGPCYTYPP